MTTLARILMHIRFVRQTVGEETDTIAGGRTLHTWDDLLALFPQTIGVKTGHTSRSRLVPGRRRAWAGRDDLRDACSARRRAASATPTSSRCSSGASPSSASSRPCRPSAPTRRSPLPYGRAPLALVAARPLLAVARVGRALTETVTAPTVVSLPVRAGTVLGRVEIRANGRLVGTRDLVASRTINKPGLARRLGWYAGRTLHHLAHLL